MQKEPGLYRKKENVIRNKESEEQKERNLEFQETTGGQELMRKENAAEDKTHKLNHMRLEFDSLSENEGFARVAVAAFMTRLNPTVEEVADVKTAVSEAVTNALIYGYEGQVKTIVIECATGGNELEVTVEDTGVGMENVARAMEPLFTTKPELERSGMGFAFMEAFMDELQVESVPHQGTKVYMKKKIGAVCSAETED